MATCGIGLQGSLPEGAPNSFQLSWSVMPNEQIVVVSGPCNTFKFLKEERSFVEEGSPEQKYALEASHTQINPSQGNTST